MLQRRQKSVFDAQKGWNVVKIKPYTNIVYSLLNRWYFFCCFVRMNTYRGLFMHSDNFKDFVKNVYQSKVNAEEKWDKILQKVTSKICKIMLESIQNLQNPDDNNPDNKAILHLHIARDRVDELEKRIASWIKENGIQGRFDADDASQVDVVDLFLGRKFSFAFDARKNMETFEKLGEILNEKETLNPKDSKKSNPARTL